jgi:hypothetical protein
MASTRSHLLRKCRPEQKACGFSFAGLALRSHRRSLLRLIRQRLDRLIQIQPSVSQPSAFQLLGVSHGSA